ncbi:MAG: class IV adenylate cyclase [Acidobacteria bacterium]|nr:class IV adenylate cyclase [Acidobacteriota bacterium]
MNLETEVKVRGQNPEETLARLAEQGFAITIVQPRHFEDNWLLDTATSDLRAKRSALRIRLAEGKTIVTYKGLPPAELLQEKLKVREELEVVVDDAELMVKIFERLGFRSFFRYQKYRTSYEIESASLGISLIATFDETPLGFFLELEGQADAVRATIASLGFTPEHLSTDSYIALQSAHCTARGLPLQDMVFALSEGVK